MSNRCGFASLIPPLIALVRSFGSAGFYLAPYGIGHVISDNRIADNDHVKAGGAMRLAWYRREGVAVDASSGHLIEHNDIVGNAIAGVFHLRASLRLGVA